VGIVPFWPTAITTNKYSLSFEMNLNVKQHRPLNVKKWSTSKFESSAGTCCAHWYRPVEQENDAQLPGIFENNLCLPVFLNIAASELNLYTEISPGLHGMWQKHFDFVLYCIHLLWPCKKACLCIMLEGGLVCLRLKGNLACTVFATNCELITRLQISTHKFTTSEGRVDQTRRTHLPIRVCEIQQTTIFSALSF